MSERDEAMLWDEVRRAIATYAEQPHASRFAALVSAARAYLRMREQCPATFMGQHHGLHDNQQQPAPAPTIAQVFLAYGSRYAGLWQEDDGSLRICVLDDDMQELARAYADTPESALRQLYDDAVQRLTRQRDQAVEKLAKLEGR